MSVISIFYWAGKGTTGIPIRGVYGPLISAISVNPAIGKPQAVIPEEGYKGRTAERIEQGSSKAIDLEYLKNFHRRRVHILAEAGADLLAFETIPNKLEAQAFAQLLEDKSTTIPAWFAFNSKDGINVVSGDSLLECAKV